MDLHIFADPDPGRQNLADPDPKYCSPPPLGEVLKIKWVKRHLKTLIHIKNFLFFLQV